MAISPSEPGQKGSVGETWHDGRKQEDHERDLNKNQSGGESDKKEDADEGENAKKDNETDE